MSVSELPALNAALNATAATLLLMGRIAIHRGNESWHRRIMLATLGVSAAFLTSYLVYHFEHGSTPFQGQGSTRLLYFSILISHTILAAALVPLVFLTVRHALRDRRDKHRRLARVTWPVWFYVSITGVIIYFMLYQWFPGPAL